MKPAELVAAVTAAGFRIELVGTGPQLRAAAVGVEMPPGLLDALKQNRGEVVAYLKQMQCLVCGRVAATAEDRERLRDLVFCDRAKCPHKS